MKRIVIDLDNTLTIDSNEEYSERQPNMAVVDAVRSYKAAGFEIIISTSRNMRSFSNSIGKINAVTLPVIVDWLRKHSIPFDEIYVGKPWCGTEGFYVDDKAVRPEEFTSLSYGEIQSLINGQDKQK